MEPSESSDNGLRPVETKISYSYNNQRGWRRWRVLRPGRGMYHDVRRRLPYYWSDIRDAWTYRTVASTIRILLPAIAYTLDMYRRTGEFFGINEALFSSALAAIVFSIFAAQPLTIVGVTGLISLFNFTIYNIIRIYDVTLYPQFMAWTGIWAAIFHWIVAIFNLCDYMRYITDFSSESFGMYVGIIYLIKGVEELVNEFVTEGRAAGYLACMIAMLYFGSVYGLEKLGSSTIWKAGFRGMLGDYAYVFTTLFWVGFSHIPGNLNQTHVARVPVTKAFHPTQQRAWLIDFWNLDVKWVFVAVPFGFLVMLLFYYDHNVSSITAQSRQFPLKKPGGFHWDFFLLGCTTFVAGILGLPMPNGLVPQAPVHTDSLTVYETELKVIPTAEGESTEIRRPIVNATAVVEQRVSHFLMGLALVGTMTGPLLTVLHTMPSAVFAGVFFVVGWGSIESNGILSKFIFLQAEERFIQRDELLLQVRRRKILLYIGLQLLGVAACVAISHTIAAIGFPVLIVLLVPLRTHLMPRWFTLKELQILDDFTVTNKVVLASLGGKPALPEHTKAEDWGPTQSVWSHCTQTDRPFSSDRQTGQAVLPLARDARAGNWQLNSCLRVPSRLHLRGTHCILRVVLAYSKVYSLTTMSSARSSSPVSSIPQSLASYLPSISADTTREVTSDDASQCEFDIDWKNIWHGGKRLNTKAYGDNVTALTPTEFPFTNMGHLTDDSLEPGNPDLYYGARPEQLGRTVRKKIGRPKGRSPGNSHQTTQTHEERRTRSREASPQHWLSLASYVSGTPESATLSGA
ncbi:hypothetical protein Purlil1_12774 [Purpureocillium lilacinum]|uniref:Bicarbonate transporter-like transmembrane domain-containing protein n=1 Tax=Purpureocillium lilacinum TaxID=33203 RepID=A0ABR0BFZ0_PURLI|nr:hypothetical protein Purlil1_12774 [Purpureocillium lilacinum]